MKDESQILQNPVRPQGASFVEIVAAPGKRSGIVIPHRVLPKRAKEGDSGFLPQGLLPRSPGAAVDPEIGLRTSGEDRFGVQKDRVAPGKIAPGVASPRVMDEERLVRLASGLTA